MASPPHRPSCDHRGVTHDPVQKAGQGPLTIRLILHHALAMFRLGYVRVAVVALILFVPPAVLSASLERVAEEQLDLLFDGRVLLAMAIGGLFRLLGPVVFAGYLDEAVGSEYFKGHRQRLPEVLRSLPWVSLLVADIIVVVGASVGLAMLVIPGIAFYAAFGLVGPVMVQERRAILPSFGRTLRISRTAIVPVVLLVIVPLTAEQVIHEAAYRAVHQQAFQVRILVEWLVAAIVGGAVGLLEVALATELMARNPEPAVRLDASGAGTARDRSA